MSQEINWTSLGRILVLIDAANIEKSAQGLGYKVNYRHLRSFFRETDNLLEIRFYTVSFETPKHRDFLSSLTRLGYSLVTKPLKLIKDQQSNDHRRKANFDVEIAVDTIDVLSRFDCLALFSGDSDFDYLVRYLRTRGKKVVVISFRDHISRELVRSADWYLPLTRINGALKINHPDLRRGR